ncbi:hypothetical protein L1049_023332 [Liquidambar formosana]|uniref:Uncharacterized protein n=1 Tax=Liquidambar formosana TaxID=63359 RepID=A0AAP0RZ85_LIQFO
MLHQRGFEARLASFRYTTVVCLYLFQVIHERFVPSVSGFWRLIEKNSTCYMLKGRVTVVLPVEFFSFDLWVPFRSLDWFLSYFHQSVHYECLQCKCQGRLKDGKQKTLSYHEGEGH